MSVLMSCLILACGCGPKKPTYKPPRLPEQAKPKEARVDPFVLRLTAEELQRVKAVQDRVIKEAPELLLAHIGNQHKTPNPFTNLMSTVPPSRAVVLLAGMLGEKRFQNIHGHSQILNTLAQLQVDGAGDAIAESIKTKAYDIYDHNAASMLGNAIFAFSPNEVNLHKGLLIPYLRDKSLMLRLTATVRLADAGVAEGEKAFAQWLVKSDRYLRNQLRYQSTFSESMARTALNTLPKVTTVEGRKIIARVIEGSPLADRPTELKPYFSESSRKRLVGSFTGRRALLQAAFEAIDSSGHLDGREPYLLIVGNVGEDFSLDGKKIKLMTGPQACALGVREECLGVTVWQAGKNQFKVFVSDGPFIKRSTTSVACIRKSGAFEAGKVTFHPGK